MLRTSASIVLAAVVLVGCGGGSGGSSKGGSSSSKPGGVAMKDIQFKPNQARVKVGQAVTWTNQDSVDHNVVATSGARFTSKTFGQGGTYRFTPRRAGTISYVCTLHPGMKGKLIVGP